MKAALLFIALLIPFALFGQEYTEASGQTTVFELKAGATASWNSSGSAVLYFSPIQYKEPISVRLMGDRKTVSITTDNFSSATLIFELFSINGSRLHATPISLQSKTFSLKSALPSGYYMARIRQNGLTIHTSTFFVSR